MSVTIGAFPPEQKGAPSQNCPRPTRGDRLVLRSPRCEQLLALDAARDDSITMTVAHAVAIPVRDASRVAPASRRGRARPPCEVNVRCRACGAEGRADQTNNY
jgi:hypothetical protein